MQTLLIDARDTLSPAITTSSVLIQASNLLSTPQLLTSVARTTSLFTPKIDRVRLVTPSGG